MSENAVECSHVCGGLLVFYLTVDEMLDVSVAQHFGLDYFDGFSDLGVGLTVEVLALEI